MPDTPHIPHQRPDTDLAAGSAAAHGTVEPNLAALDALPPTATGGEIWATLGAQNLIEWCYQDATVSVGVCPQRLGRLLAALDARFSIPATLSASIQLATALPILATSAAPPATQALARTTAGKSTVALAATDVTAGTDLTALRTRAVIDSDGLTVHGRKTWITNATTAEHFLVLARHADGRHFTHFTWVLVPADAPGAQARPADSALFADSGVGDVEFDHVRLPREHVLGRSGMGLPHFARHIGTERLAGALWGVALCHRTLSDTYRHLSARPHGEDTLWDLDGVRQRFAGCLVRVRELDALTQQLADQVVREHDAAAAATLKAAAASTVDHVLGECAQLWGAAGFASGGIQQTRAQAALFGIGGGATEVVLSTLADNATKVLADLDRARRSG